VDDGEIVVASKEELHAASLSGKQLLALCAPRRLLPRSGPLRPCDRYDETPSAAKTF
jgi:hypothetical protein